MNINDIISGFKTHFIGDDVDIYKEVVPIRANEYNVKNGISFCYGSKDEIRNKLGDASRNSYAVITDEAFDKNYEYKNVIYIENARAALALSYKLYYGIEDNSIKYIGITGTNGKTSTAYLIYTVFMRCNIKAGFIGTGKIISADRMIKAQEYSMTTPPPDILYRSVNEMIKDGCEVCIMEVSSHALDQDRVFGIHFDIGIFTNLGRDHLDYHKTQEHYYASKIKLLNNSQLGIYNIDDESVKRAYLESNNEKVGFGIVDRSETFAMQITSRGLNGQTFFFRGKTFITRIKTNLQGRHNIYNLGLAICALFSYGLKPKVIKEALEEGVLIDGRMEVIHDTPKVIIDYAHTPDAVENLLISIKSTLIGRQRVISVMGCGGERDRGKRPIMGKILTNLSDYSVFTEDNSRSEDTIKIISEIIQGASEKGEYEIIPDRKEAIKRALTLARENDVVLIIGKGHERYMINGKGSLPFDERVIVEDYYKNAN